MNRLDWNSDLVLDIDSVDSQHRYLFDLYNRISESSEEVIDEEGLIDKLLEFTEYHFDHEEKFLAKLDFPAVEWERHRRQHREFLEACRALRGSPTWKLLDYFQSWFLAHTLGEDLKVKEYLDREPDLKGAT